MGSLACDIDLGIIRVLVAFKDSEWNTFEMMLNVEKDLAMQMLGKKSL